MENILRNLRNSSFSLYLVKKEKKNVYTSFRLPNGIEDEVKNTYMQNIENFTANREYSNYDFVHKEKGKIVRLDTNSIDSWCFIKECIKSRSILSKQNFSDDYKMIIIDCSYEDNKMIKHTYLIAKYMKIANWYKKGIKIAFTSNGLVEKKDDIIALNGCIDAIICDENTFVLVERNFEEIFNYFEAAKKLVRNKKEEIQLWDFLTSTELFFNKVEAGKTRMLKLANAIKNTKTDWKKIKAITIKNVLITIDKFSSIAYNDENKIICTETNVDLLIEILREVFCKQLFTEEIIETKGI